MILKKTLMDVPANVQTKVNSRTSLTLPSSPHNTNVTPPTNTMFRLRLLPLRRPPTSSLRRYATTPPPAPPSTRLARIESRLPRFLHRYTTPLRTAPVSHITAFLILHELTAVVPLLGLAAVFHYTNWLPPYISEGKYISDYTAKFGRYLRKKGWMSDEKGDQWVHRRGRWFGKGETGVRMVSALATAYAITKVLLPLRLVVSVWGTPWFARWTVLPVSGWLGRTRVVAWVKSFWSRGAGGKVAGAAPAAGTGAVGAGVVVPKEGMKVK